MKEVLTQSVFFGMFLTLFFFQIGAWINKKLKVSFANPLLIAVACIMATLFVFDLDYEIYQNGAKYIQYFLTPATVSLAVPLYRHLTLLKKHPKAIFISIFAGVMTAMSSILLLSFLFQLQHQQYITLLPKSITTALGMGISEKMGGVQAITVIAISVTGITGTVGAEVLCKLFRIKEPVAKGLAIGTSCHALGTSRAMEMGEIEGAMSSLALVVTGLMTVLAVPLFAKFL